MTSVFYRTPCGFFKISSEGERLVGAGFVSKMGIAPKQTPRILKKALKEVDQYFKKKRRDFSFPLDPEGTPFQKKTWKVLQDIPYSKTVSYQEVAKKMGHPKAARAVGSAVGANPFCIFIPCHRVIASSGSLGGYAFGLAKKKKLLFLENISFTGPLTYNK